MWPILVALVTVAPCTHAYPGIRAILTEKGLEHVSHVAAGWLQERLGTLEIPDVTGSVNIGPWTTVDYVLNSMSVSQFNLPEPSVAFSEGTGVMLELPGLSIAIAGNWHTSFGIIHDGGSFDLAVYDVDLSSMVELETDYEGHLHVSSLSCGSRIGDMDINFHGGASFLFQPFVNHFKNTMRSKIEDTICLKVNQSIEDLEQYLVAMKDKVLVNKDLFVKMPLTNSPVVNTSGVEMDFKGVFYSTDESHRVEPPFHANPFELPWQRDRMLSLGISDFFMNSALFVYFHDGLLQVTVNDSMIPQKFPIRLNTSSFGGLIPQLPKLYPGLLMQLQLFASKAPQFSFSPGVVTVGVSIGAKASAIQRNSSLTPLFRLDMDFSFRGKAFLSGGKLSGMLELNNLTLTLVSSDIGPFQTAAIEHLVTTGVKTFVLPRLNAMLHAGIPLPSTPRVSLVNTELSVQQGFVAVVSDVTVSSHDWEEH